MNRPVVIEISNTLVKCGLIDASSLPLKTFPSIRPNGKAIDGCELISMDILIELIEYTLVEQLEISKESFENVQLTLILPSQLVAVQLPTRAKIIKTIYERIKVAGVFLGEVSVMATLGSAHGTALVLNFDGEGVEMSAVNDFSVLPITTDYYRLPSSAMIEAIKGVFSAHVSGMNDDSWSLPASLQQLLQKDLTVGTNEFLSMIAVSADQKSILIGEECSIPVEVFAEALEEVFRADSPTLMDSLASVINRVDADRRAIVMNHVIVTGEFPALSLLAAALRRTLFNSSVIAISDYPADNQPTTIAFRGIPDYYIEIKDTGLPSIAWFGATLAGKYAFADSRTFIPSKN